MTDRTCSVDGCERTVLGGSLGYCSMHYQRVRKGKPIGPARSLKPRGGSKCSVCDGPMKADGFCAHHLYRFRKYGDPNGSRTYTPSPVCSIDGCEAIAVGRTWCRKHYSRWKKNGDPMIARPKAKNGEGALSNGYRVFNRAGRRILEHRAVMEDRLGRQLFPDENVHHINGVRDDNRLENLELWSTRQPQGQRAVDKLAWAREIVARYGPIEHLLKGNDDDHRNGRPHA